MNRELKFDDSDILEDSEVTWFLFINHNGFITCFMEQQHVEMGCISKQNAVRLRDFLNEFLDDEDTKNEIH